MAFSNVIRALILLISVLSPFREQISASLVSNDAGTNVTKILNSLLNNGYDKRVRPNYGGPAVEVGVTMYIISISSVSETQMDFTTAFYFRQLWTDKRLSFIPESSIDAIYAGADVADQIWVPDTFFANEKVASFHTVTTPNTFLHITPSGGVLRSVRLSMTASCPMNLQYFPMDRQVCTFEMESYGYSMADITYIWAKGPGSVGLSDNLELPQFKVVGHRQLTKLETFSTGNYSRLVCEIHFARSFGYYLLQIYIPAGLIVVMSWIAFWLNRKATGARVTVGVTTVLTITTLLSTTNSTLPKISYIKSIDVFLLNCFVMVFASFIESAIVGYCEAIQEENLSLKSVKQKSKSVQTDVIVNNSNNLQIDAQENIKLETIITKNNSKQPLNYGRNKVSHLTSIGIQTENTSEPSDRLRSLFNFKTPDILFKISPKSIDIYSRVLFPLCFVCFNLMYWIIYLHVSNEFEE